MNRDFANRLEQAYNVKIAKLFWIAGQIENDELKECLESIDDKDFERMLPELYASEYFGDYRQNNEEIQLLIDFGKFGLLAEVHTPHCDNFTIKKGKPVSWSSHDGWCSVDYVYGETLEELTKNIEQIAESNFKYDLEKAMTATK